MNNVAEALRYYEATFAAVVLERLKDDSGDVMVAQLSIDDADFWIQDDPDARPSAHGGSVRMILSVDDPEGLFPRAIAGRSHRGLAHLGRPRVESGKSRGPVRASLGDRPSTSASPECGHRTTVDAAYRRGHDRAARGARPPPAAARDDIPSLVAIRETPEVYRSWRGGDDMAAAIEEDRNEVDTTTYVIERRRPRRRLDPVARRNRPGLPARQHRHLRRPRGAQIGASVPTRSGRWRATCASTSATTG